MYIRPFVPALAALLLACSSSAPEGATIAEAPDGGRPGVAIPAADAGASSGDVDAAAPSPDDDAAPPSSDVDASSGSDAGDAGSSAHDAGDAGAVDQDAAPTGEYCKPTDIHNGSFPVCFPPGTEYGKGVAVKVNCAAAHDWNCQTWSADAGAYVSNGPNPCPVPSNCCVYAAHGTPPVLGWDCTGGTSL